MKKNIVYGSLILLALLAITLTVILVMRARGFEERVRIQENVLIFGNFRT